MKSSTLIRPAFAELDKARACAAIMALPPDKMWRAITEEAKAPRSLNQNAALWAVAYPPICNQLGYRPDELHEVMCEKFFGTVTREVLGITKTGPVRTTTTDANGKGDVIKKSTFCDFYAMVQEVGASVGVWVPDPDPRWRVK